MVQTVCCAHTPLERRWRFGWRWRGAVWMPSQMPRKKFRGLRPRAALPSCLLGLVSVHHLCACSGTPRCAGAPALALPFWGLISQLFAIGEEGPDKGPDWTPLYGLQKASRFPCPPLFPTQPDGSLAPPQHLVEVAGEKVAYFHNLRSIELGSFSFLQVQPSE